MVGVEDGVERMGDRVDQKTFMNFSSNKNYSKMLLCLGMYSTDRVHS